MSAKKYVLKQTAFEPNLKIDYAKELNPSQLDVVLHGDGPALVLAGAGSGKTRTLVYRVLYLMEKGITAPNILFVTFTNKAAFEMKMRVERGLGMTPRGLWCGTFHHVGHRSLRMYAEKAGLTESFGILDEEDSRDLVRTCYDVLPFKPSEVNFPKANVVHKIISFATNVCKEIPAVLTEHYSYFSHFENEIQSIAKAYEARKRKTGNLDYDDLLTQWIRLLEDSAEVRDRFQEQFQYCLVDEYQDTNRLQSRVMQILSGKHRNLLVVGDDAQSIYSFRGADIRNILEFPKTYADAKIYRLETNYRSTPQILDLANDSIKHNTNQFPKQLKSVRSASVLPELVRVRDMQEQSAFVAQRILEFVDDEGMSLNDIAVLFRARFHSAELEMELAKRRVAYVLRGGVRFFEQAHIKDVLSYLKLIENPADEISWLRALKQYAGIGEGFAAKIFQEFQASKLDLRAAFKGDFGTKFPKRAQAGFARFKSLMKEIVDPKLDEHPDIQIDKILESGYAQYVRVNFDNAQERLEDLRELVNFAHTYKHRVDFLSDISLRESFKGESIGNEGGDPEAEKLVLSTIHQAKGLEWKVVFLIGLSEGQFPHHLSLESDVELEEERRLFYVAATRAKDHLILVHSMTRFEYNMGTVLTRPSVFLSELSHDVYDLLEVEKPDEHDEETISLDDE